MSSTPSPAVSPATTSDVPQTAHRWRNVAIGGGGYVTGFAVHPSAPDHRYIRTDVGGVYRRRETGAAATWEPLMDGFAYPQRNYYGVDGLALAPSRPGRMAIAAGQYVDRTPSDVLLSDDGGRTWRETGLNRAFGGNMEHRMDGECLAFAPDDDNHLVVGTRRDGLFETRDGGRSWRRIEAVPSGEPDVGIRVVVFGAARIYVGVAGAGVFASRDRGATWTALPGSPRQVDRMALAADGTLFATARRPGGVWRLDGDAWREITPMAGRNYHALAVDPHDPRRLVASPLDDPSDSRFRLPIFLSTDGGDSWRVTSPEVNWSTAAGWLRSRPTHFAAATASLTFDPHQAGRVWLTDWYAVWTTDDIADRPVRWRAWMDGHEEMFLFGLATPPRGAPLLTAMADNVGFRHEQLDTPPAEKIAGAQEASGVDFCEADPRRVAVVSGRRSPHLGYALYVSDDNARTFVRREVPTRPEFERAQRIAVSATDRDRFVLLANDEAPYLTRDAGRTWERTSGAPAGALAGRTLWTYDQPLAADRVEGGRFYLLHESMLFRSDDGGATWGVALAGLPRRGTGYRTIAAAPGVAGWLAVGLGDGGLWLSRDGGGTLARQSAWDECLLVAWGAPLREAGSPTLFIYGRTGSAWGIYRSADAGETWERITSDALPLGAFPSCLAGDRQTPGRVYLGTNGRGVFYGEPEDGS